MAKVIVYKDSGEKAGSMELPAEIFAVEPQTELVHQAVMTQMANRRTNLAHTKTRSERRGGGAKPWAQKGTGRARAGSRRSPIWKGGGITFGPRKEKNFKKQMNTKAKRKALFMVLTDRVNNKKFVVVQKFNFDKPQTSKLVKNLAKLPLEDKPVLLVLPGDKGDKPLKLSARNIPGVGMIRADSLNIKDLLSYEYVLLSRDGVKTIIDTFGKGKDVVKKAVRKPTTKKAAPAKKKARATASKSKKNTVPKRKVIKK